MHGTMPTMPKLGAHRGASEPSAQILDTVFAIATVALVVMFAWDVSSSNCRGVAASKRNSPLDRPQYHLFDSTKVHRGEPGL